MKPDKCLVCNETLSIVFEEEEAYTIHCSNCLFTFSNCAMIVGNIAFEGMWFNDKLPNMEEERPIDVFGSFDYCCRIFKLKSFS